MSDPTSPRPRQTPAPPTQASFYVSSLPGLPPQSHLSLYAGTLPATTRSYPINPDESDASLYFFLAKHRHIPKRERLLIWLNGGEILVYLGEGEVVGPG